MVQQDQIKVLLIEDDEDDYIITRDHLAEIKTPQFHIDWVATYTAGLELLEAGQHEVCLVDYRLGERDGLELLREAIARGCQTPIIILTGQGDHEVDVAAMKAGAADYVYKGRIDAQLLERIIRHAIERKQAEIKLRRLNRAYQVLSDCNQALVRASDENQLLQDICRIIVDIGGYRLAWVGYAEQDETKSVRPAASAGFEDGYLETLNITWADTEQGRGPTGTAIRTRKPIIARDIQNDPQFKPWRSAAVARGYASSIALPLIAEGQAIGTLNIYTADLDAFDEKEVRLLEELAGDLAFGIQTLRARIARQKAEAEMEESEHRYRTLFENTPIGIGVTNLEGELLTFNEAMLKPGGYTAEDAWSIGNVSEFYYQPETRDEIFGKVREQGFLKNYEVQFRRKDGSCYDALLSLVPIKIDGQDGWQAMVLDITERVRAGKALQEAEIKYRTLVEQIPAIIYTAKLDRIGSGVYVSPQIEAMFGFSPAEWLADPELWMKQIHPEDRESVLTNKEHLLQSGEALSSEHRVLTRDGQILWVQDETILMRDESGQPILIQGVTVDITERKQAEEALRVSEERYRTLFNSMIDGFALHEIICDQDGTPCDYRFLEINPAFEQLTGLKAAEIVGKTVLEVLPDTEAYWIDTYGQVALTGNSVRFENYSQALDKYFDVMAFSPRKNSFATVFIDITERKRAGEALEISEQRYRSLFDGVPVGLYRTSTKEKFLDANPALVEMLGFPDRESLMAVNFGDLYENIEEREQLLSTLVKKGLVQDHPARLRRKDGEVIWVEGNTRAIKDDDGQILHLEGSLKDVTEQVQTNMALRQRDAILEAISFASGKFLRATDWQESVQDALGHLGQGADVCRAYIFENHTDAEGVLLTSQRYEWAAPGIDPQIDNPDLQNFPLEAAGFARWVETLSQGDVIQGHVRQFPESEREILAAQEIQSILIVPIFVSDVWWGFIGYDVCRAGIEWAPLVAEALQAAADTLGAAIQSSQAEKRIRRQLQRLEALRKIGQAISGSLDLKIILDVVVEQVMQQLQVDSAVILLYFSQMQTLEYGTGRGFRTTALQHTNLRIGEGYAGRAALERRSIHIPDLSQSENGFAQSPYLKNEDYISYFGVPLLAKGDVKGVLEIFHREKLDPDAEWLNYLETLAGQAAIAIDNATLFRDLQRSNLEITLAYDNTLEGWAKALELRDQETEGHSRRVVELTMKLARKMGMSEGELVHVRRGALLHDIGKMGIPDKILQKPAPLDEEEWETMRQHPAFAHRWLSSTRYLQPALDIPYSHHEKWDGTGYPLGLQGEQIPLAARIFAVVDVWDALNSDRPYREAWPEEKILAYLQEQTGKHFDPRVVETFLSIVTTATMST
jgi:PAS domain S-box-containing protein/putative nucleotidyltransferase with HDIG domain